MVDVPRLEGFTGRIFTDKRRGIHTIQHTYIHFLTGCVCFLSLETNWESLLRQGCQLKISAHHDVQRLSIQNTHPRPERDYSNVCKSTFESVE